MALPDNSISVLESSAKRPCWLMKLKRECGRGKELFRRRTIGVVIDYQPEKVNEVLPVSSTVQVEVQSAFTADIPWSFMSLSDVEEMEYLP